VGARVAPVLAEVRSGGLATAGCPSYLEAKGLLLLQYCAALVALITLRAEGAPVEGHPVVTRREAAAAGCAWGGPPRGAAAGIVGRAPAAPARTT
jgi:hypothetical protein